MARKGEEDKDSVDIADDPYKKTNLHKEKKKFEKESKDYPVLGEDNESFIVDTKQPNLLSRLAPGQKFKKKVFSAFQPIKALEENILPFKKKESDVDSSVPETTGSKEDDKFFMQGEDEAPDDDDFILDGFEGVYKRDGFDWRKIAKAASKVGYLLLAIILIFMLGFFASKVLDTDQGGPCPYECCVDDADYEDKLCPGLSECEDGECIKPACPEDFECCPGTLYEERPCEDEYSYCSQDFECLKKQCPYECCTASSGYIEKDCVNGGNCINNECYLDPCPHECCIDELDHDDKSCTQGEVCRDNECIPRYIDITQKIVSYFSLLLNLII
ncbi:MAG: hypothetical protein ACLFTR_03220 [Candidatus Woesearchaeota archaeon]